LLEQTKQINFANTFGKFPMRNPMDGHAAEGNSVPRRRNAHEGAGVGSLGNPSEHDPVPFTQQQIDHHVNLRKGGAKGAHEILSAFEPLGTPRHWVTVNPIRGEDLGDHLKVGVGIPGLYPTPDEGLVFLC
jgi:hypothetical protein